MIELALTAFATLFVVIDPLGNLPVFVTLTSGSSDAHKRRMAMKGVGIGVLVLGLFAFAGDRMLEMLGISLPAFRAAGGLLLMIIAVEMVFDLRNSRKRDNADKIAEEVAPRDISVFPIAMPLIAGPGGITSLLLLMGRHSDSSASQAIVLGVLATVLLIQFSLFLLAGPIERLMGDTVIDVFSRLLGIILAALAVQYVFDGIYEGLLNRG